MMLGAGAARRAPQKLRTRSTSILGAYPQPARSSSGHRTCRCLRDSFCKEAIGTLLGWIAAPSPGAREWLPPSPDATCGNQLLREGKEALGSGGILRPVLDLSASGSAPARDVSQRAGSGPGPDLESIAEALIVRGREQGNLTFDDLAQGFLEVLGAERLCTSSDGIH
jgi:hypothetical protein